MINTENRIKYLCWILLLLSSQVQGQYFNFSQYDQTPLRVNPAYVVASDAEQVNLIYRNQNTAAEFDINSGSFSYQRPIKFINSERHFLGLGVTALDDRTGGTAILTKQNIGVAAGFNLLLDDTQILNIGCSALAKRLNFSLDGLTTGSQYGAGSGFDPNLSIGEIFAAQSKTTLGINAGVLWQKKDEAGNQLAHFGWALYDFNRPDEFLKGQDRNSLPGSNIFQLGARAFKNEKLSVYPQLLVLLSAEVLNVNAGVVWEYSLPDANKFSKIALQTNYVLGSYGTLGFQLIGEKYSAGLSYDLGLEAMQVANSGAIEISFAYHKLVREKKPPPIIVEIEEEIEEVVVEEATPDSEKIVTETIVEVEDSSMVEKLTENELEIAVEEEVPVVVEKEEVDENVKLLSEYSPSTAAGALIYSNVKMEKVNVICEFDFNQDALKEEVQSYLNELGQRLKGQNIIAIEIIGHTDAVGSANYNMQLSTRRAHAIAAFLAEQGIPWAKMSVTGKGESQPLSAEASDEENRRVEVLIFSQQ